MSDAPALWQLRVLSGGHEGACVDLAGDTGTLTLGTDARNDVVLRDAPFAQAHLHWDTQGWRAEHEGTALALASGQALAWQDLHLAVDKPDAPWAYAQTQAWPDSQASTPEEEPTADSPSTEAFSEGLRAEQADVLEAPAAPTLSGTPWRQRMRQQRAWRIGLVGLGSLLAVAAVSAWTQWQGHASAPLPRPAAPETAAVPEVSAAQLQAVLNQAGLDQAVRVEKADGQRHALWGVVPDQDQLEAMLRDVMALTRKVVPHVLVQSEFEAQAQALQSQLPPDIQITTGPGGQVWLAGAPDAPAAMQEALALVRSELPEAVRVRAGTAPRSTAPAPVLQLPGLPSIVAVQSGPQAYVLLADGRRILPGGQMNAWRLLGIEGQAIVLEDATGQSRRVER